MKEQNDQKKCLIIANHLSGKEYRKCVSLGLFKGNQIQIIGKTRFGDHTICQIYHKLFAIPSWMMEKIEVVK